MNYETPQRKTPRPFWPPGWTKLESLFVFTVFLGAAFADDYVATLGWPRWLRMVGMAVVLYTGLWLSGHRGRRDRDL